MGSGPKFGREFRFGVRFRVRVPIGLEFRFAVRFRVRVGAPSSVLSSSSGFG